VMRYALVLSIALAPQLRSFVSMERSPSPSAKSATKCCCCKEGKCRCGCTSPAAPSEEPVDSESLRFCGCDSVPFDLPTASSTTPQSALPNGDAIAVDGSTYSSSDLTERFTLRLHGPPPSLRDLQVVILLI